MGHLHTIHRLVAEVFMSIPKTDIDAFEAAVTKRFAFLEQDFNLRYSGLKIDDADPRDTGMVARYSKDEFRVSIAWAPFEMSLSVLIRLSNTDLGRRERYVYLEPFIAFVTNGAVRPVVPQIYPGMSVRKIEEAMELRSRLFENSVGHTLETVSSRLKEYYMTIRAASADDVRQYHQWYQAQGKAA